MLPQGHLVTIKDFAETCFVGLLDFDKAPWIGAYRDSDNANQWHWTDETPWQYTSWDASEPASIEGDLIISYISNTEHGIGQWSAYEGSTDEDHYVCEIDKTTKTPKCLDGWTKFNKNCYKLSEDKKTWPEANKAAQRFQKDI